MIHADWNYGMCPHYESIDINKSVSIKGGYSSNFIDVRGKSTLNGDLIISDGMPIVEDFILQ